MKLSSVMYKIKRQLAYIANKYLGTSFTLTSPDRPWLEHWIRANSTNARVLSVGVSWYTMHYPSIANARTWDTIDSNADQAKFGVQPEYGKHFLANVLDLSGYQYDVVIANGVFGKWGIDTKQKAAQALLAMSKLLTREGVLLIGYNDNADGISYDLPTVLQKQGWRLLSIDLVDRDPKSMHTYIAAVRKRI